MGFFIALTPGASFNNFEATSKEAAPLKGNQVIASSPVIIGYNYCCRKFIMGFGLFADPLAFINWKKTLMQVCDWGGARASFGYKVHDRVTTSAFLGAIMRQTKRLTVEKEFTKDENLIVNLDLVDSQQPTLTSYWQLLPFVGGEVSIKAMKGLNVLLGGSYILPLWNGKSKNLSQITSEKNVNEKGHVLPKGYKIKDLGEKRITSGGFKLYAGVAYEMGGSK